MMRYILSILLMVFAGVAYASPLQNHDAKQPVDISADTLEVLQQDRKAIFKGNVIAIQGEVTIKADRMTVFYKESKDKANPSKVSKIEVEGNAQLYTPEESARGHKGVYDVDKKEVRLAGNVTLTRQRNVLKGEGLVYSFVTGKSEVTGGVAGSSGGGRVRGLFIPNSAE